MIRTTRNAIHGLEAGHFLTFASLWTIPGIYDVGILTMMGSKKTMKNEYVRTNAPLRKRDPGRESAHYRTE